MVSVRRVTPVVVAIALISLIGSSSVLRADAQDSTADAIEEITERTEELSALEADLVASQERADEVNAEFWQHQQAVWDAQVEAKELTEGITSLSDAIEITSERMATKAIEQYMAPENFSAVISLESVTDHLRAEDLVAFVQDDAARTVEDLEAMVREREESLERLSEVVDRQQAEAEAAEELAEELSTELSEARAKRDDLDAEIDQLRGRLDELEAAEVARVAQAEAEAAVGADAELTDQLDTARQSLDELASATQAPTSVMLDTPLVTPEPQAQPSTEPEAQPSTESTSDSDPDPAFARRSDTESGTQPSTEPEAQPDTESETQPSTESEAQPDTESETQPDTESETQPTPAPTAEPTPEPTAEPTPEPTAEPTPEPTPEPAVRSGGGYVCPVNGPFTHIDDYGYARPQGGHEGNDLMADKGVPIVAVTSGRLEHKTGGLGGLTARIHGDDGGWYYFAHMSAYENEGIGRVEAGQVIGYVGNTGDAAVTPPHLHFEMHLGGYGNPVNPYPYVVEACGH